MEDYGVGDDGLVHVTTTTTREGETTLPPAHVLVGAEGMASGVRRKLLAGGGAEPASRGYVVYRGVAEEGGKPLAPGFSFQVTPCPRSRVLWLGRLSQHAM